MLLTPMRYKEYVWPHNPRVYSIDYERIMAVNKVPFGLYYLQDLGRTRRVMKGEGEFIGEDAYTQFGQLANVFYSGGPGQLIPPCGRPPTPILSPCGWSRNLCGTMYATPLNFGRRPTITAARCAPGLPRPAKVLGSDQAAQAIPIYYQVVKGDTLWSIAMRYGMALSDLIALNPQIKNPNLIHIGDEVRVS